MTDQTVLSEEDLRQAVADYVRKVKERTIDPAKVVFEKTEVTANALQNAYGYPNMHGAYATYRATAILEDE